MRIFKKLPYILIFNFIFGCSQLNFLEIREKKSQVKQTDVTKNLISKQSALKILSERKSDRFIASENNNEVNIPYFSDQLPVCKGKKIKKFDAKDYPSWANNEDSCRDIRQLILSNKHIQTNKLYYQDSEQCSIKKGKWTDFFSNRSSLKSPKDIEVLLTIPFSHIHYHGAADWTSQKKWAYLNHIKGDNHHILTSKKYRDQRKDLYPGQDPSGIDLPLNSVRKCEYVGAWIHIKKKWGLCVNQDELLSLKKLEKECRESYSRSQWKHWVDEDKDCLDARQEALLRDAVTISGYEKKNKACKITSGEWIQIYNQGPNPKNPLYLTEPHQVDVDHFVPLKNAHLHGGWAWPADKKMRFANELNAPYHLISVHASQNRSKGARGPEEYMPPEKDFHCDYLKIWVQIKHKWNLMMNEKERYFIEDYLKSYCL